MGTWIARYKELQALSFPRIICLQRLEKEGEIAQRYMVATCALNCLVGTYT